MRMRPGVVYPGIMKTDVLTYLLAEVERATDNSHSSYRGISAIALFVPLSPRRTHSNGCDFSSVYTENSHVLFLFPDF
jgi:hypothetical protein